MAYDSKRDRTVLFGGLMNPSLGNVVPPWTYEWDGSTWSRVATSGPPRRDSAAAVYDAKVKCVKGPLVGFSLPNALGHPRMGISISRKVGTAVRRNRIKRLMREAFRLRDRELPRGYDLVIVVRPHVPLKLSGYREIIDSILFKSNAAWEKRLANS